MEKVLLGSLVIVPVTGLLVATGDDWLPLHVAAQIVFLPIAGHAGLVLRHTVLRPSQHLSRMI